MADGTGGGGGERENKALKTALLVAGGLVVGWLTIETAFKPFLELVRGAISKSDPARDPDDKEVPDGTKPKDASAGGKAAS